MRKLDMADLLTASGVGKHAGVGNDRGVAAGWLSLDKVCHMKFLSKLETRHECAAMTGEHRNQGNFIKYTPCRTG